MADTWEWGPWAQQGEDYVKQQRDTQAKSDLQKQTSQSALQNMLAGKSADQGYKIADENRQAENAVPALRTMLGGGSPEGQALGFGPQSTDQDYRGLAKGAPGIATTILGKRLENVSANQPKFVTVPRGAQGGVFNPRTQSFTPQVDNASQTGYGSETEANAAVQNFIKTLPAEQAQTYRPQIHQDATTGRWLVQYQTGEPISLQDPYRLEYSRNVAGGMDPAKATDVYMKRQAEASGARQFAISQATPPTVDWQNQFSKAQQAANAFEQLQSFTEPERRAFVLGPTVGVVKGVLNKEAWFNTMSGLPGGASIVNTLGGKQATIDRFNQFHTLLGSIRELAFVTGGKQLTKTEEDVVLAKIPTGQEKSYSEFQAKFQYATKLLKAVNDGMILANQVPKGDPNYNMLMGAVWRQAFAQNKIDLQDPERNVRSNMDANERLRQKYGPNKGKTPNG